jgi:3-phenylpropionate/cinnamic acid dioxygenase small subunit
MERRTLMADGAAGTTPAPLATEQIFRIHGFLLNEAELLDDRRWGEWLALLADDFEYLMPLPVTRDNPSLPAYDEDAFLQAENRETLDAWVERLSPQNIETAWSENPPARIRHFVTNIRPRPSEVEGEVNVRSNVLISIARGDEQPVLYAAERRDLLRADEGGGWQLASRRVYLEQNLPTWSMRMIV